MVFAHYNPTTQVVSITKERREDLGELIGHTPDRISNYRFFVDVLLRRRGIQTTGVTIQMVTDTQTLE